RLSTTAIIRSCRWPRCIWPRCSCWLTWESTFCMVLSIRESSRINLPPIAEADVTVRRRRPWHALRRNPIGLAGFVIVIAVVLVALIGPVLWSVNYSDQVFRRLQPPGVQNPMGTDNLGRDVFSRVIHGAQVSLQVAS